MRWVLAVYALWALVGCVSSNAVTCPSGIVCPEATECVLVANVETCVTPDQRTSCEGLDELAACDAEDESFRCIDGFCVSPCGNGTIEPGETCDDGNRVSGDRCSARCFEEVCGNGIVDTVNGEQCDDGIAGLSGDGCSSKCQLEVPAWVDVTPRLLPQRAGFRAVNYGGSRVLVFGGFGPDGHYNDTWLLEGAEWRQLVTPRAPSPRQEYGMAYDSARKRVVLFGGFGPAGVLGDTWEFDGVTWTQMTPASSPSQRRGMQIAYDQVRMRTVLFGGNDINTTKTDTWEWDGSAWTERTPASNNPPASANPRLVMHGTQMMLFVHKIVDPFTQLFEAWRWNGATWTVAASTSLGSQPMFEAAYDVTLARSFIVFPSMGSVAAWNGTQFLPISASNSPGFRVGYGFAYDGSGVSQIAGKPGSTLTSSGFANEGERYRLTFFNSAYSWSGLTTSVVRPKAEPYPTDVYNSRTGELFLFGYTGTEQSQGWQLGRTAWTASPTTTAHRQFSAAAYDSRRDRVVVFGGATFAGPPTYHDTTRELGGDTWQTVSTANAPAARAHARMAYDAARGVTILFGGVGPSGYRDDTWSYDGTDWTLLSPAHVPPARASHLMAYDAVRERIVLFGGAVEAGAALSDTWEWDGTDWTEVTPMTSPPGRTASGLTYDPLRRKVVLVGGIANFSTFELYADRWEWDGATWSQRSDAPLPRTGHQVAFDQLRGGLLVHGGYTAAADGTLRSDVRILRYTSVEPRETCLLATDDLDGDGAAGCADPDCWGRCTPTCPPGTTCPSDAPKCGNMVCDPLEDPLLCPGDNC